MSKINEIQAAILALEGGAYQKLLDQYLHKRYHLENIQPLGVQNATNKSTRGIPDTYVIDDDKFILICYGTVSEQPANKIQRDIEDCLNTAKTKLDDSKIAKVICCYTSSNITPEQTETLKRIGGDIEVELISLGTLSHDLVNNYRSLAADHLHIKLDTYQIFEINEFVVSYDKSGTNAPIDTKFRFRQDDLDNVVTSISENNITVVSGPSGIGKTRLALEACRLYAKEDWNVFCIRSNGQLLYNDINDYLDENEKYLLLFDDANKVAQFANILEECFSLKKPAQVKIIITIRDYAKKQVALEVKKYSSTNEVVLGPLKDDEIKSILRDNYNIQNQVFLDKICQVSKGNARLAVLAGLRSIESGLPAINNAEDIFKNYYDPIIDKIGLDKNDLILLGIIAIFNAVSTEDNDLYNILIEKYLDGENNIDSIERLYELELIDWYEKEIVRISDQSLGNYIIFYDIYEKKWIDLGNLIQLCIPNRTKLIINLIDMLLNLFRSDDLNSNIKASVNDSWENAEPALQHNYMEIFYPLNPLKGLLYLKNYVQEAETRDFDLVGFDFEAKKNTNRINTKEIEILAGYKHTNHFNDAMLLFFSLYEKRPDLFMDFYFAITNHIMFDKFTYRLGYSLEQQFLDYLWDRCEHGHNYNYSFLYLRVAEYALSTEYIYTESSGIKNITLVRAQVIVNEELKALRADIWHSLIELYSIPAYHDLSIEILSKIHINGLYDADSRELCSSDFNELYPFLTKEKNVPFEKMMIIGEYRNVFDQLGIAVDNRFDVLETSKEYKIYRALSKEFYHGYSYEESKKKRYQEIKKLIYDYSLDDFNSLFITCKTLEKNQHSTAQWNIKTGLETVFLILEGDVNTLCDVTRLYLINCAPFNICPTNTISCILEKIGYDKAKTILCETPDNSFDTWYSELLSCVPENVVNNDIADDYFAFQMKAFEKEKATIIPLRYITKYLKFDASFLDAISSFLLSNTEYISHFFGNAHGEDEVRIICESYVGKMNNLIDLYFSCDHTLFDYEDKLFWALYAVSPNLVWERYIRTLKDDRRHQRDENSIFACIWRTPEYAERIDFAFSVLTDMPFFVSDSVFVMLFATGKNDTFEARKKNWILNKMLESVGNVSIVSILLDAVMAVFPDWKEEALANYLKYDQDVEHFKQLNLLPTSESWSGSEIPVINRRIAELESIRDSLIGPEYIEHKVYLEDLIRSKEHYRDEVRKREYLEDNMVF